MSAFLIGRIEDGVWPERRTTMASSGTSWPEWKDLYVQTDITKDAKVS